jgi:uncharacterized membrane protein YjgN (DUF898 family)
MDDLYLRVATESERQLEIEFTASGSEYFRIWIVNLLLTLVTLGLYYPFAKARRIRYFYANTLVDGQALAFHGDPWKMFRGFVLLALLGGAYSLGGKVSPMAGLIAFCLLAAIWPALWRASLQFRLGNTSWRGMRFRFEGDLKPAYFCFLPIGLPMIVSVLASLEMRSSMEAGASDAAALGSIAIVSGLASLLITLLWPWALTLMKRYQHGGYSYANQRTQLDVGNGSVYGVLMKAFGMMMAAGIVVGILAAMSIPILRAEHRTVSDGLSFAAIALLYAAVLLTFGPYVTARLQNLFWGNTRSEAVRFSSALSALALFWLTLRNWVLTLLTLSLYRPFAVVQTTRLRLAAMRVHVNEDIEVWTSRTGTDSPDATGDAAADFFGFDIGL